jgi:TPR repeat protein
MASFEIRDCNHAVLGGQSADTDSFFELGIKYSSGRNVPVDYVAAHKWFNLAAMKGNQDAVRLRREIAAEMTDAEIAPLSAPHATGSVTENGSSTPRPESRDWAENRLRAGRLLHHANGFRLADTLREWRPSTHCEWRSRGQRWELVYRAAMWSQCEWL